VRGAALWAALLAAAAGLGCRQDMHDQPKHKPLGRSEFFADGRAARPIPEGTVARGQLREDEHLYQGKVAGVFAEQLPLPLDMGLLQRGRERYQIFCTPCHGPSGEGDGIIVRRGFRKPTSFHVDRLRQERAGYFYDVMTRGFGTMPDYAAQIAPPDRWAVVAYIRALQLSQHATLAEVPPARRAELGAQAVEP
jgi:mono/diheme cytochrome c family protein